MPKPSCVAFLPGAAGRGEFWEPVSDALSGTFDRVISFDWPGFGGLPGDATVGSYDDLATLVIAQLTEPTVLVAQSMGGVVAALVAGRRPDLVSHLVLAVTSGGVDMDALGAADWRPGSRVAHPENPAWMWDDRPDTTALLANLPMRTLLVWATDDAISPLAVGQHLNELIPRSTLATFESDDHWVARDNADEVAELIRTHIMPAVGFLHTAEVHVDTFGDILEDAVFGAEGGVQDVRVLHAVEPELLDRARSHGSNDPEVLAGLEDAIQWLVDEGADVVVCTCSTISGEAERRSTSVPVLRVDRPMAAEAVLSGTNIAVVASVESTVAPTMELLHDEAQRASVAPTITVAPCFDAWPLFERDDIVGYHRAVAAHVNSLDPSVDTVVLAQASMLGALSFLDASKRRVLVSPPSAVAAALALVD